MLLVKQGEDNIVAPTIPIQLFGEEIGFLRYVCYTLALRRSCGPFHVARSTMKRQLVVSMALTMRYPKGDRSDNWR